MKHWFVWVGCFKTSNFRQIAETGFTETAETGAELLNDLFIFFLLENVAAVAPFVFDNK